MGLYNHRTKNTGDFTDQKWDYINLPDFKARGCGPGFAYFWLWCTLITSVAVYGLDAFVAVNLLIFDQWSSKIEPEIPLYISKWIFSACIIMSFLNLGYEAVRATRVIKRRNVAECYLDSLAVRWESIRFGEGQGWKRFLVFAELTKSKKGAEYTALFTYFSLKAWIRVLICSGPRQVINAFTFKSVYESKLAVKSADVGKSFTGFFEKIGALAEEDYQQALVLGSMAFTFVVWVFSLIFLIAAVLCYLTFLCHWIPKADGGLSGYCERKINQALKKIVTDKVNKALAKGEAKQFKEEWKNAQKTGAMPPPQRTATLPTLPNLGPGPPPPPPKPTGADSLPEMPMLDRQETVTTLPPYASRPASPGGIEMANMAQRKMPPSRAGTMASATTDRSYSAKTSLLNSAAEMGQSPEPTLPALDLEAMPPPPGGRGPGTPVSQGSLGPRPGLSNMNTDSNSSMRIPMTNSPAPMRSPANGSMDSYNQPMGYPRPGGPPQQFGAYDGGRSSPAPSSLNQRSTPAPRQYGAYNPDAGRQSPAPSSINPRATPAPRPYDAYNSNSGRASPAPSGYDARSTPAPYGGNYNEPQRMGTPAQQQMRSATGPVPPRGPYQPPQRNLTAPVPPRGPEGGFDRSPTAPPGMRPIPSQGYGRSGTPQGQPPRAPYGYDVESQRNQGYQW